MQENDLPQAEQFESHEDYLKAVIDSRIEATQRQYSASDIKQAVTEGVSQALAQQPQQPPLTPWPDDEHGAEREAIKARIAAYENKAEEARKRGESRLGYTQHDYVQRAALERKELDRLPPEPQAQYMEDADAFHTDKAVEQLYDKNHVDHQVWDHPRMQVDAPILLVKANQRAKTIIRLPMEESPHGNVMACKPRNMVKLDLPADVVKTWQAQVYGSGGDESPDAVLRRSWRVLHSMGFATTAKRAFAPAKDEEKGKEKTPNLARMTFKEFEAYRSEQERKKYGEKRMFPRRTE